MALHWNIENCNENNCWYKIPKAQLEKVLSNFWCGTGKAYGGRIGFASGSGCPAEVKQKNFLKELVKKKSMNLRMNIEKMALEFRSLLIQRIMNNTSTQIWNHHIVIMYFLLLINLILEQLGL